MPFTLSHPAAVLMVARHPFVMPALVTGCVAPDVPEFIGIQADHPVWWEPYLSLARTHSFTGIGIDLVYALALVPLYMLVKRPVLAMVPKLAARVREAPGYGGGAAGAARRTLWTLLSALIGIVTHLVWDSFTHYDMFVDEHVSFMRTPVIGGLDVLRFTQYVSSVAGLVAIGFWLRRKWSGAVSVPPATSLVLGNRARNAVIFALVAACGLGVAQRVLDVNSFASIEVALRRIVIGAGFGIALGLVIYSFVWHAARIRDPRRQVPEESGSARVGSRRA
ncbi:DUF4184 family protein [Actinacidiphila glaucinigra]|uniref:DUF4184 family protein n=1 Tax=Actinacidiphila glaucinigra TaxID=235986 RepID=UPI003670C4A3